MTGQNFDIAVVGGGPGGYVAAIRAAQLGLKTALIEREHLGGICLNWGCIPTKALLRSAEVYRMMKQAGNYGLKADGVSFDLPQVVRRSRQVSAKLQAGVGYLLKKNKVAVFEGTAALQEAKRLTVTKGENTTALGAANVVLATGARPLQLPGMEADGRLVWTYKEALVPDAVPKRLLVVGGGAIGLEFASFYNELGSEVIIVEALDQLLPAADPEISGVLLKALQKRGVAVMTRTFLRRLEKKENEVEALLEREGETFSLTVDRVLLALGVVGNVEGLGLERTRAKVERGFVKVDQWLQTDEPGLYAIGDLAGPPCLAHKASHEAIVCVEKIAGVATAHPLRRERIPYCTYTHPQVATVGMTEREAQESGREIKVGRFPFSANGKAIALGETEGVVKTIHDAGSGELLGAHMVGAEVTEMIQGYGIALNLETTEEELMRTVFAHPTLSEMMHESVLDAFGKAIHL